MMARRRKRSFRRCWSGSEAAIDEYQKVFDVGYRGPGVHADLAAAYALEGKMDEAKSALVEARRTLIPVSPSNGTESMLQTYRPGWKACARPGCRKNERSAILPPNEALRYPLT